MKKYASKFLAIISLFSLFLQSAYPVILAYEDTEAGNSTSCSLSVSRTSLTQGESVTFTLTSGYGYSAYWGGSNNGQPIGDNHPLAGFSSTANSWQGIYRQDTTGIFLRYVEILNEEGNVICTTNTVSVSVEPQSESLTEPSTLSPTPDPWDDYSGGINLGQIQDPDTPPEPATPFETPNIHYEGESCEPSVSCSTSVPNAEDSSKPLYCRSIDQDNYQWITPDYANSRCNENNINLTAVCNQQTFYCNGTTWSSQPISTITEPTPSSQTFPSPSPELIPELTAEPPTALSIPVVTDPTSQATAQEVGEGLAVHYARERMQSFATDRQQTEGGSQNNLAYTLDQTTETAGNAISTATGVVENTAGQINSTIQNFGIGSPSQPPSNITCTLKAEPQSIEAGGQVSYTIESSAYGYSAFWKGSENGQPINYQVEDFSNTNYWTKSYTHNTTGILNYSVEILNDAGETLCTTNPVEIRITERTAQQPEDSLKEQQTLDRFNEANKHLGITVSGNLNNPTFSVQATSTYATTATSGTQFLFDSSKEEQKKFFTESKKRVDSMVLTTADFFLAGAPDILINKAGDIVDQYSLTAAVCQKAGVDVLFDPSYREQITGSIRLKGKTGLDFKQWQDFAKAVNPSSANPFSEEQIEQNRQKAYELIKKRLDSTSFAYQSRLDEVNGMNEEQAKQGCSQAFEELIANQKEVENELQAVEIMLLAGGPINTAQEAGLKAAAPKVKEVGKAIGGQLKPYFPKTVRDATTTVADAANNLASKIKGFFNRGKPEPLKPQTAYYVGALQEELGPTTVIGKDQLELAARHHEAPDFIEGLGERVGASSYYGNVYVDKQAGVATKIIKTPGNENLQQMRILRAADGKGGLPRYLGTIVDENNQIVGFRMEYIDATSMQKFLENRLSMSREQVIQFAEDLARSLDTAHQATGLPHGDLYYGVGGIEGGMNQGNLLLQATMDEAGNVRYIPRLIDYGGIDYRTSFPSALTSYKEWMEKELVGSIAITLKGLDHLLPQEAQRISNKITTRFVSETAKARGAAESEYLNTLIERATKEAQEELGREAVPVPHPGVSNSNEFIKSALAAEQQAFSPNLIRTDTYELLLKQKVIQNILDQESTISANLVNRVIKADALGGKVQQIPEGYILETGKDGTVKASIKPGRYIIKVAPLSSFDIQTPIQIEIPQAGLIQLPMIVKQGSGKVERLSTKQQSAKSSSNSSNLVVTVLDSASKDALPWTGLKIELRQVNQSKAVSLIPGWNLVALEVLPQKPLNASTLLQEIAKQEGYATTVSTLENGAWKSFVVRGDKTYSGDDFPITAGKAYFVKALKPSVLVYQGQELVAPIKLNLTSGWNGVGVPYSEKPYQAADFIDTLNTKGGGADTASRWESGLWDTFVKLQDQKYGENFMIEQGRGYLLKVAKGLEFSP